MPNESTIEAEYRRVQVERHNQFLTTYAIDTPLVTDHQGLRESIGSLQIKAREDFRRISGVEQFIDDKRQATANVPLTYNFDLVPTPGENLYVVSSVERVLDPHGRENTLHNPMARPEDYRRATVKFIVDAAPFT